MKEKEKTSAAEAVLPMLSGKCPYCLEENMFLHGPYHYNFSKMHKKCPSCEGDLEPEPGFYFGAMYITYAFNIALLITFFAATYILVNPESIWVYFTAIFTPSILLLPVNFRWSRSIYLYLFGGVTIGSRKK
ncbi:DUF983 domain-containing protein [Algivirga pacifica]|uniref:DUF983 domain-containing protein n=1 Tax=Algivirga pacifica TaxID=1162670 RepID=A0ABP9CZX1_9BACT